MDRIPFFLTASFPKSNHQKVFWVFPKEKLSNDVPKIRTEPPGSKNKTNPTQGNKAT